MEPLLVGPQMQAPCNHRTPATNKNEKAAQYSGRLFYVLSLNTHKHGFR